MEKKETFMKFGYLAGFSTLIVNLVVLVTHKELVPGYGYLQFIPFAVFVILNGITYSNANDNFVTFGNIFLSCFKVTAIAAVIMVLWTVVVIYAFPNLKDEAIAAAREAMSQKNTQTDEQMEMAISIVEKGYSLIKIVSAIFSSIFMGAIFSVIAGGIAKKKGELPVGFDNV